MAGKSEGQLRPMQILRLKAHLVVGPFQQRAVRPHIDRHLTGFLRRLRPSRRTELVPEQLCRLPRARPLGDLLGEAPWIPGRKKRFTSQDARGLVMAMAIGWRAQEARDDDVWSEHADDPDDIAENGLAVPLRQGLIGAFREAKIVGACEELFGPIHSSGGE